MIYQPPLRGKTAFFLTIRSNEAFSSHWHKEMEILYCIKGSISLTVSGKRYDLLENQMILVNSTEEHSVEPNETSDSRILLIEGGDALLGDRFEFFMDYYLPVQVIDLSCETDNGGIAYEGIKKFNYIIQQILAEKDNPEYKHSPENYWYLLGYTYELFASLCRFAPFKKRDSDKVMKRVKYFDIIQPIISYVEKHYDEQISIQKAANIVSYERTSFCRIFHSVTGMTFLQYLNLHRIDVAKRKIVEDTQPISEIGKQCGIPNAKSFTRIFKQYTGMLPSEYKKAFAKKKTEEYLYDY